MSRLTPAQIDAIHALRGRGYSTTEIAKAVGCLASTVSRHSPQPWRGLRPEQVLQIRELRADGHTAEHVAAVVGCNPQTVRNYAPGRPGKVPVAPLREAFLASPMTAADVARELGWWIGGREANAIRVKHTLGLVADRKNGHLSFRKLVDAETVQLIAEAIGISPWAVLPDEEEVA